MPRPNCLSDGESEINSFFATMIITFGYPLYYEDVEPLIKLADYFSKRKDFKGHILRKPLANGVSERFRNSFEVDDAYIDLAEMLNDIRSIVKQLGIKSTMKPIPAIGTFESPEGRTEQPMLYIGWEK